MEKMQKKKLNHNSFKLNYQINFQEITYKNNPRTINNNLQDKDNNTV